MFSKTTLQSWNTLLILDKYFTNPNLQFLNSLYSNTLVGHACFEGYHPFVCSAMPWASIPVDFLFSSQFPLFPFPPSFPLFFPSSTCESKTGDRVKLPRFDSSP